MFTFSYPSIHCSCYLLYDQNTRHEYLAATSSCAGIVSQGRGCSFRSGIIIWPFFLSKGEEYFPRGQANISPQNLKSAITNQQISKGIPVRKLQICRFMLINPQIANPQTSWCPRPQIANPQIFGEKPVFLIQNHIGFPLALLFTYVSILYIRLRSHINLSQNCPKSQKSSLNLNESI